MAVAAGSIAFVAFDFDNTTTQSKTEGFAFVALRPIAASDSIRFVDGNWNGTSFDGLDGQIVWQNNTGAAIPAGRLIEVSVGGVGAMSSLTPTTNLGTISGKSGTWDVATDDSLYAVADATLGSTSPGAFAAAVTWGDDDALGSSGTGASVVDFDFANSATYDSNDVAVLKVATINASQTSPDAARTAYTTTGNWLTDDADDQVDTDTSITSDPEWPALSDPNSPLNGKTSLVVDNTAPAAPTISNVTDDAGTVTGPVASSGATNDTTPTVTVALNGTGAAAPVEGDTVTLRVGGTAVGTATLTATNISAGNVTIAPSAALSGDGSKSLTVTITDGAGNVSAASGAYTITLDTTPPTAPTIGTVADNAGSVTGALTSGGATDDTTLALAGTAAASSTVEILNGSTVLGTATANSSGAWTFTTPALSGAVSLTARATDTAGNSASSAAFTTTIDQTAPAAPSIGTVTDNAGSVTGTLTSGGTTDDTSLALAGTAEAGSTVQVLNGSTVLGSTTANGSGAWSFATAGLSGSVSLTVRATDAAGNQGPASTAFTTTIDQTAPAAPTISGVTDDAGVVTGAVAAAGTTNDTTPTVTIALNGTGTTAPAVGDRVALLVGGTQVASKCSTPPTSPPTRSA